MNQFKQWIENKKRADDTRPPSGDWNKQGESFMIDINDEEQICIRQNAEFITLSYDGGLALREWLNRIYTNGT